MDITPSNGLQPGKLTQPDASQNDEAFNQNSVEHTNEMLLQEQIQSRSIEELIMIAQDQSFANDEDAIFHSTKILSARRPINKTPLSVKNASAASKYKIAKSGQQATSVRATSHLKQPQGQPVSPSPDHLNQQLNKLQEDVTPTPESESQPPSPRRTIYYRDKEGNERQESSPSQHTQKARITQESKISVHSQDIYASNKDISNLGILIEKNTDSKTNKVFAKAQIISQMLEETVPKFGKNPSQTNVAARGRGVAAVISQDHTTEREEKSLPGRASQLSYLSVGEQIISSIQIQGNKIAASPKRSQRGSVDSPLRRRDLELAKAARLRSQEEKRKEQERKLMQRQQQNLQKYQKLHSDQQLSDQQLARLYDIEEQKLRMEIETQNKSSRDDMPGRMPATRDDDFSPVTVRTPYNKQRSRNETAVNELNNQDHPQAKEQSQIQPTQMSSYQDIESPEVLRAQRQTSVQIKPKKIQEPKVTQIIKPQKQRVSHPILLMDGSPQPIPMTSLLDHDGLPLGADKTEKQVTPKLAQTKDFSSLSTKHKQHLAPLGMQQIMTTRNFGFKDRKKTLPLIEKTAQNVDTLLYMTERDTQNMDELNRTHQESINDRDANNSPTITKAVVFITKKEQPKQVSPFNQVKQVPDKLSSPKRYQSPSLLNINSPQQQMDLRDRQQINQLSNNSNMKSSKTGMSSDPSPAQTKRKSVFTQRKSTLDQKSKSKLSKHESAFESEAKSKLTLRPQDIVNAARNDLKMLMPQNLEVHQELLDSELSTQQQIFRNQILRADKNISQRLKEIEPKSEPSQNDVEKTRHAPYSLEEAANRNTLKLKEQLKAEELKRMAFRSASKPATQETDAGPKQEPYPRSLYFSNKFQPKLSDLREALRANSICHHKFNPKFESKDFKQYYKPALDLIKKSDDTNEEQEQQRVFDILLPRAVRLDKADKLQIQMDRLYEKQKVKESFQQMRADALTYEHMKKPKATSQPEQEVEHPRFVARANPFIQHLESDGQIESFVLGKSDKETVKKFDDQRVMMRIPNTLQDAPFEKYQSILQIMEEYNNKRNSYENPLAALKRIQREYEELNQHKAQLATPVQRKNTVKHPMTDQQIQMQYSQIQSISRINTPEITEIRQRPAPDFVPLSERRPKVLVAHRKNSVPLPMQKTTLLKSKQPMSLKEVVELYIDYLEGLEIAGPETDVMQTKEELMSEVLHICRQLYKQNIKVQDVDGLRSFLADYDKKPTQLQYNSEATTALLQQNSFARLHRDPSKELDIKQRQEMSKLQLSNPRMVESKSEIKLAPVSDNQSLGKPMDAKQVQMLRQSKDQMRMSKDMGRTHDINLRVSKDEPLQPQPNDQAMTIIAKLELNTAEQFHEPEDLSLFGPADQKHLLRADNSVTQIQAAPFINSGGQSTAGLDDQELSQIMLHNLSQPLLDSQGNLNVNSLTLKPMGGDAASSMLYNPSEMQFAIAPSQHFAPSMKHLKLKASQHKYANLSSPKINKSSCNHCIEKKISEYNSDKVSTMLGTDAQCSMEALAQQKSKILSQGSEYITALPSKNSQAQFEQELLKQLSDPQALKNIQIKQLRKLARRCEELQQETMEDEIKEAESQFEQMHDANDKWKDAITTFIEQPTDIETLSLAEVYESNRKDECVQQNILTDIEREKKEIAKKLLVVLSKRSKKHEDIWRPTPYRVNRELAPYIY